MKDKELIEYSAKSVGFNIEWEGDIEKDQVLPIAKPSDELFNPLVFSEDAFRLLVTLELGIWYTDNSVKVNQMFEGSLIPQYFNEQSYTDSEDKLEAARRAITTVAATIGANL